MAFNNPSQPAYLIPGLPSAMGNTIIVGTDAASNLAAISSVSVLNGGTGLSSLTAGRIPFGNNANPFGSSANLFWDDANNQLNLATGTVTLPALSSVSSTNTGLYFPAVGSVAIANGGLQSVLINSSLSVTIPASGTATPTYASTSTLALSLGGYATIANQGFGIFGAIRGGILLGGNYTSGVVDIANIKFVYGPKSVLDENAATIAKISVFNTTADSTSGGQMVFSTTPTGGSSADRLWIDSAGRVGIGSPSQQSLLSVGTSSYTGPNIGQVAQFHGSDVSPPNGGAILTVGSTSNPAADLGGTIGFTALTGQATSIYTVARIAGRLVSTSNYSGYLTFETTGTGGAYNERMRITGDGNIHTPAGSTGMNNGFFYMPAADGAPTGAPTAITGTVPFYYDTTNNQFYVYNGAWKKVALT